jgi:DoxX
MAEIMSSDKNGKVGRVLLLVGRLALAIVFLVAAYAKMKPQTGMPWSVASVKTSLAMFAMGVDSYQLLSTGGVEFVSHWLPPFELFLGLWLLAGIALRYSALITTLLLGGFFAVQFHVYLQGKEISCGCFGPGERLGPLSLLRDASFIAVALAIAVGAFMIHRKQGTAPVSGPPAYRTASPDRVV